MQLYTQNLSLEVILTALASLEGLVTPVRMKGSIDWRFKAAREVP